MIGFIIRKVVVALDKDATTIFLYYVNYNYFPIDKYDIEKLLK